MAYKLLKFRPLKVSVSFAKKKGAAARERAISIIAGTKKSSAPLRKMSWGAAVLYTLYKNVRARLQNWFAYVSIVLSMDTKSP